MKTYQLNMELQVDSPSKDAKDIGDKWHTVLCDIIEDALEADHVTVSGVKCTEVHKFDELHFGQDGASPEVEAAIDHVNWLIAEYGVDRGFVEFDITAEVFIKSRWPKVTGWECGEVTYSEGVVTLHDLYVIE